MVVIAGRVQFDSIIVRVAVFPVKVLLLLEPRKIPKLLFGAMLSVKILLFAGLEEDSIVVFRGGCCL